MEVGAIVQCTGNALTTEPHSLQPAAGLLSSLPPLAPQPTLPLILKQRPPVERGLLSIPESARKRKVLFISVVLQWSRLWPPGAPRLAPVPGEGPPCSPSAASAPGTGAPVPAGRFPPHTCCPSFLPRALGPRGGKGHYGPQSERMSAASASPQRMDTGQLHFLEGRELA